METPLKPFTLVPLLGAGLLALTSAPEAQAEPGASALIWEQVPSAEVIDPDSATKQAEAAAKTGPPRNQAEAEQLLRELSPIPEDYEPVTTLAWKYPKAFVLPDGEVVFSAFQLSPVAGGGDAGGSGNQNFVAQADLGLADSFQFSVFFTDSDDPLFSQPVGTSPNPANKWQSAGVGGQWQLVRDKSVGFAIKGSLENFFVESGGCRQVNSDGCSQNIFNGFREAVSTNNIVGSLSTPLSWKASPKLELTIAPGVSFLPDNQGPSGAQGEFFGTTVNLAAGALWSPLPELRVFGSTILPLGPGTNSFNDKLEFSKVPIFSGGIQYALNPRIAFDLALSNGFGASPATEMLTIPSSNELLWMAKWSYVPGAQDSAPLAWNDRSRSLSLGGLTVGTAIIPSAGRANTWLSGDNKGSLFTHVAYSLSNDFQIFLQANIFEDVGASNPFAGNFLANNGEFGYQAGGKAILLHQLRGAPFSLAAAASFGQDAISDYLFGELIATWEANRWLAFNAAPKFARSGIGTPMAVGLGANLQLGKYFQFIPELNLAVNSTASTNGTLALRWLPIQGMAFDLFLSNAAGMVGAGQLLDNDDALRVGVRGTFQF